MKMSIDALTQRSAVTYPTRLNWLTNPIKIMEPHNSVKDQFQPDDQQNALVPKGIELYKKVQAEMGDAATSEDIRLAATNELITWYHQEVKGPFTDGDLNTVMNTVIAAVTMNIQDQ